MTLYEFALLGDPSDSEVGEVTAEVGRALSAFGVAMGKEVALRVKPAKFEPDEKIPSAALFFATPGCKMPVVGRAVPVVPVVRDLTNVTSVLPPELRAINALSYSANGAVRAASALLEAAGFLSKRRRVFISYRREEARAAALQLFEEISARRFDVFLDTHGVDPGEDFQEILWHRLSDSDVLIMLDTEGYFLSRWTALEFGRALAKHIAVLQVVWPGVTPSARTDVASRIVLVAADIESSTNTLGSSAVDRVLLSVERMRSMSIAVRRLRLISMVSMGAATIGAAVQSIGPRGVVTLKLADGSSLAVYPEVGVPTSESLQDAHQVMRTAVILVAYDHVGLRRGWMSHLSWLDERVKSPRFLRIDEVAWQLVVGGVS